MDVCLAIKQRLEKLGLEQRDLAAAAEVTESYISQLLDSEEIASRAWPNRYLRQDGEILETPERQACEAG